MAICYVAHTSFTRLTCRLCSPHMQFVSDCISPHAFSSAGSDWDERALCGVEPGPRHSQLESTGRVVGVVRVVIEGDAVLVERKIIHVELRAAGWDPPPY